MKKSNLVIGGLIIFLAGCISLRKHDVIQVSSEVKPVEDIIKSVEDIIISAELLYSSGALDGARWHCDKALKELFSKKHIIDVNEYEFFHSDIALLRIKINQSKHSMVPTVKCDLFPLVWNKRVEKWINYYTGRGREDFTKRIQRSRKYIKHVKEILNEHELPLDLVYVPVVESGYYPFARSKAGAVGMWQFMPGTAKLNGLRINDWIDERRDPYKSTVSAAKVLKELYENFGTWELALAAYNYGSNGVKRRIKKWGTDDYWELYLPRETENFVPKIMATIFILKEPELFGFKSTESSDTYKCREFKVKDSVDLRDVARWSGAHIKEIQLLNPELKQMCTLPGKDYNIRIPEKAYEEFVSRFNAVSDKEKYLSKKEIDRRIRRVVYYRVRRGDSIWKIARKFNVSVRKIKKWNRLTKNIIYPKQKLKIYRHGI